MRFCSTTAYLMVEKSSVLLHKDDTELLGRRINSRVVLTAAGSRDVLGARPVRAVDVVDEGELGLMLVRHREVVR